MKKNLFYLFTLLFLSIVSIQAQTTAGKEFWVTYGGNHYSTAEPYLLIRLASHDAPATGTIYFNSLGISVPFNIPAKQIFTHTLTASQAYAIINTMLGISDRSIHITSDTPISVYTIGQGHSAATITHILPVTALETDYYHISYTPATTYAYFDAYAVIATEENTKIYHDSDLVATLNTGQVYYHTSSTDMTGTHITANKPVAFFIYNVCPSVPEGTSGCDALYGQLSPVNVWGKKFFVPVSHLNYDRVRIVAANDNTNIVQTGGVLKSSTGSQMNLTHLKAGQFVELEVYLENNGCLIEADKPVGVCVYLTSKNYNQANTGDPAQAWLPPIEQSVFNALMAPFIPAGSTFLNAHHALLFTSSSTKNETRVSIGGNPAVPLSGGVWRDHQSSGFSFYNMPLSKSNITYHFTNPSGLTVLAYGTGDLESYYYLIGASLQQQLTAEFYANDIHYKSLQDHVFCTENIQFRAEINGMSDKPENLRWFIDGVEEFSAKDQLSWNKSFLPGEYEISMWVRSDEGDTITLTAPLKVNATITTSANPVEGGSVEGDSCYQKNETAHLIAKPNTGYEFVNWTVADVEVSVDNPYSFTVTKSADVVANFSKGCFNFDNYATILWNNTFILNLNKIAEDGYDLIGCKWFRNDIEEDKSSTINDYSYSAGPNITDLLELAPTNYRYELITNNHGSLCSTKKILTQYIDYSSSKMSAYPNPVISGLPLSVEGVVKDESVQVYNQYGICVYSTIANDTAIKLTVHLSSGLYLLRAGNSVVKILVLE